jgi:FixJ family two-component response regulator
MPELNGLDMILELTRYFLDAKVIAISGIGGEKNVLDVAKLLGARRTIQKPFSMVQLLNAVRYELAHYRCPQPWPCEIQPFHHESRLIRAGGSCAFLASLLGHMP